MIYWNLLVEGAGYSNEKDMWNSLFVNKQWGVNKIGDYLGVSGMTIRSRILSFGYEMRNRGGSNNNQPVINSALSYIRSLESIDDISIDDIMAGLKKQKRDMVKRRTIRQYIYMLRKINKEERK